MGTNAQIMAWICDQYAQHHGWTPAVIVTGKPVELGGSLGREAATGRGCLYALEALLADQGRTLAGTVAIQGFGNVGSWTARLMAEQGAKIVAVSDVTGAVHDPRGLDLVALQAHVKATRGVKGFAGAEAIAPEAVLTARCEVLVPAALEGQLTRENARARASSSRARTARPRPRPTTSCTSATCWWCQT